MEPAITGTLAAATEVDLTDDLFADIGWTVDFDPELPASSSDCGAAPAGPTVEVLGCATNVANVDVAGSSSCKLGDIVQKQVESCVESASNHGNATSCVANKLNQLKRLGLISNNDQGEIQSCVAGTDVP
jgi:hypothetical protein